jgi:hypothetical protein
MEGDLETLIKRYDRLITDLDPGEPEITCVVYIEDVTRGGLRMAPHDNYFPLTLESTQDRRVSTRSGPLLVHDDYRFGDFSTTTDYSRVGVWLQSKMQHDYVFIHISIQGKGEGKN